jgi:sugar phosphate isomerase/epimerase
MERRSFIRNSLAGIVSAGWMPHLLQAGAANARIRLGGPVFVKYDSPEAWISALQARGYRAAYCPVSPGAPPEAVAAYRAAADRYNIMIAEVGAWSNPISPDTQVAGQAMEKCIKSLALADEIGASCCVNISGSKNTRHWAGPHPENLTPATFDLIVETTRKIIDAVKPSRTFYTLEMMPWTYPDTVSAYRKLIKAINRPRFGVHLDPVNMITTPDLYFRNGDMIRDCFRKLGPLIKSCHAKDIILHENTYLTKYDEVIPGKGNLAYGVFLSELAKLSDVPLMMEHLDTDEAYQEAAQYIRSEGVKVQVGI